MNINIRIDDFLRSIRANLSLQIAEDVRKLVDYCRGLELESHGTGLKALSEIAEDSMDKKTYASIKRAIENPKIPYKIILV